jgi:hypothetical protein
MKKMNEYLLSFKEDNIKKGKEEYLKTRAWEFVLATLLVTGLLIVSWLYIVTFCEIYHFTASSWVASGLLSEFISIIMNCFFMFVHLFARFLAKTYRNR